MPKITFMGAGSTVFARNVLGDCMCTPALRNSEIALYDIDSKRLEESEIILGAINKNTNEGRANIKTYLVSNVNNLTQATTTYSVSFNWHGIPCAFLYL